MNGFSRDLLLVSATAHTSAAEFDRQLDRLNAVLYHVENWTAFCTANEIIHLRRHKIIRKPHHIQAILRERAGKAFVFVYNKN
ncbi:hypothetical protein [Sediminibacterium soli]|uniref:hypothetical protein n=1 Tax=Sediminibacterium soli TaxID=2698829 RepID=UPI00137ACBE9|nr:hypothetical protein [Sediminibacterium soli]NCI45083.1 hypothetical protein [Sediminibacterium soli]